MASWSNLTIDTKTLHVKKLGWVVKVQKQGQDIRVSSNQSAQGTVPPGSPVVFTSIGQAQGRKVITSAMAFIFDRQRKWNGTGSWSNMTIDTQVMHIKKLGWLIKVQKQGKQISWPPTGGTKLTNLQVSGGKVTHVRLRFVFDRQRKWNGKGSWKSLTLNTQYMNISKLGKLVKIENTSLPLLGNITDTLVTVPPLITNTTISGGQQTSVSLQFILDRQDKWIL